MSEFLDSLWAMIGRAFDLVSAFVDLVRASSVTVPALHFVGIVLVAFLLGLLLGRITKRVVQKAAANSKEREMDRVVLDFERLTPLGLSEEEEAENPVMDISDLRPDQVPERPAGSNRGTQQGPTPAGEGNDCNQTLF